MCTRAHASGQKRARRSQNQRHDTGWQGQKYEFYRRASILIGATLDALKEWKLRASENRDIRNVDLRLPSVKDDGNKVSLSIWHRTRHNQVVMDTKKVYVPPRLTAYDPKDVPEWLNLMRQAQKSS